MEEKSTARMAMIERIMHMLLMMVMARMGSGCDFDFSGFSGSDRFVTFPFGI